MKLLVDMNLSPRWVGVLNNAGIEAAHWSTLGANNALWLTLTRTTTSCLRTILILARYWQLLMVKNPVLYKFAMTEVDFPQGYEGTATPGVHRAVQEIEEQIREHIISSGDMRLFSLMHLLGQISLRMEQVLWPEEYERIKRKVEEALREADKPGAKSYSHVEVTQYFRERRGKLGDKSC